MYHAPKLPTVFATYVIKSVGYTTKLAVNEAVKYISCTLYSIYDTLLNTIYVSVTNEPIILLAELREMQHTLI